MKRQTLSLAAARRIALAAQGFATARPETTHSGSLKRTIDRLGLLQIDSVNVLARAHYLPLFSRLGNYDSSQLDTLAWGRKSKRGLFEFWAHEASLLPTSSHPLWRWRMERAAAGHAGDMKGKLHIFRRDKEAFIDKVRRQLVDRGPLAASDLESGTGKTGPWWGWSDAKFAMEWLFFAGEVTTATRRGAFERVYDLTERVLPADVLALPTPAPAAAQRELLRMASRAMGVATAGDLRDYFRLPVADTKARMAELVEAGDLLPVTVEGWKSPAYLDPAAREENPLAGLGDLDAKPINASLASVVLPELSSVDRVANDFVGAARMAAKADWLTAGAVFAGAVIASSTLDRRADEFALQHADKRWLKGLNTTGNALPWVALGGAALVTLDDSDPVRARTGYTALEAGGTALIAVTGMKYAVGRARPQAGLGSHQFQPFSGGANNDSFPSGHAITAWSVLTPFALEYDAPWLYGVASLTNAARVGSRQHWLSDTVGGSLLGYGIGRLFWESNRDTRGSIPRITLSPSNIEMKWTWK